MEEEDVAVAVTVVADEVSQHPLSQPSFHQLMGLTKDATRRFHLF